MKKSLSSLIEMAKKGKWLVAICTLAILSGLAVSVLAYAATNRTKQYIGEEQARAIALGHAGISEQESFIKVHLDREKGRTVYDVEFYSGNTEYDYEIDAMDGAIVAYDREIEHFTIPSPPQPTPPAIEGDPAPSPTPALPTTTPSGTGEAYIGEGKAKVIALNHAGISEQQATFIKVHLDREKGRIVYDVEFYSGNTEYDYEIDAVSGAIVECDREIENYTIPKKTKPTASPRPKPTVAPSPNTVQYIGEGRAKSIALNHAGVPEQQATFIKVHLDRDDGRMVYDVEFYSGNTEYDYEIDAVSGTIREYDHEVEHHTVPRQPKPSQSKPTDPSPTLAPTPAATPSQNTEQYIGEGKAKSIALHHAGLAESQVNKLRVKLDREKGKMVYEVDFKSDRKEYEYDIDAVSGAIRKSDVDHDD